MAAAIIIAVDMGNSAGKTATSLQKKKQASM
jgi:hypothetical protein